MVSGRCSPRGPALLQYHSHWCLTDPLVRIDALVLCSMEPPGVEPGCCVSLQLPNGLVLAHVSVSSYHAQGTVVRPTSRYHFGPLPVVLCHDHHGSIGGCRLTCSGRVVVLQGDLPRRCEGRVPDTAERSGVRRHQEVPVCPTIPHIRRQHPRWSRNAGDAGLTAAS